MHPARVACREPPRLGDGIGGEDVDRDRDVGLVEEAGAEGCAVGVDGIQNERGRDVIIGAERQTESAGELGAGTSRAAVQPDLDVLALGGRGVDRDALGGDICPLDEVEDVEDVLFEAIGVAHGSAQKAGLRNESSGVEGEGARRGQEESVDDSFLAHRRKRRAGGGARGAGAADTQIEPSGMQRRHDSGGLDDLKGGVVADDRRRCPDADLRRRRRDRSEQDVGGGSCDTRVQMVLGEPIAGVPEVFGATRERDTRPQSVGRRLALPEG